MHNYRELKWQREASHHAPLQGYWHLGKQPVVQRRGGMFMELQSAWGHIMNSSNLFLFMELKVLRVIS